MHDEILFTSYASLDFHSCKAEKESIESPLSYHLAPLLQKQGAVKPRGLDSETLRNCVYGPPGPE